MNPPASLLGASGTAIVALYFGVLVVVGVAGRLARRDDSLSDFYLGGRALGPLVLFLTLYATQYSGLTLVGFAGNAYRQGFSFLVAVTFGCSVMGGYLMLAPRLQRLSAERHYVTPGDFIADRFKSRPLTLAATAVFVFALASYILSNLKAIGVVVEVATGGEIDAAAGIVGLSLLMVAYETLGGLRAVAWTDVLQGTLLLVGCGVIFVAVGTHYGGLGNITAQLAATAPAKVATPGVAAKLGWTSTVTLVCFGVSIYPHAVQRIYAARDAQTLRRSLQLMLLMPFVTTLLMILVGLAGAAFRPGLGRDESEQVVLLVLQEIASQTPALHALIVLFVTAVVAAIMSTIDSALLSTSSLIARDLLGLLRPQIPEARLTAFGKRFSWALMAVMAYLAIELPQTLWRLTEVKLEVLSQVAPAMFLGLHVPRVHARAVGYGLTAGLGLTLALWLLELVGLVESVKPLGVHAGTWGLCANFTVTLLAVATTRPTVRDACNPPSKP